MLPHGEAAAWPGRRAQVRGAPERRVQAVGGDDERRAHLARTGRDARALRAPRHVAHGGALGQHDPEPRGAAGHRLHERRAADPEAAGPGQR